MRKVEPSKVYRLFYPAVPAVVATSRGGRVYAMPVVSILSLSNSPPLVGLSSSPSHSTCQAIVLSKRFSVSWLDSSYRSSVEFLGSTSGALVKDKLKASGLHHRKGSALPVPVIDEAVSVLECSLDRTSELGDHLLLVGEVKAARASGDFSEYWRFKSYTPILYTGSPGRFTVYGQRPLSLR